ncbi:EXS_family protein [Hexamita inflata]|uniref:EXS_family protein n=1 Tax=Hexamita inflata TaxID=28002 RepID=A0ABP1IZP7_9EUKA
MQEYIIEWQHKYIQADDLKALCKEIDALDLQLHSKTDQQEYSQSASQVVQKIKSTSRQFLVQVSSQVDVLESFFLEQVKSIGKKSDEIEGLAKKAIQIKLEPTKCGALVDKMKDVLGKISVLQNFTIYNYDQLQVLCRLHDSSSQEAYNSLKWLEEKLGMTSFHGDKLLELQNRIVGLYAQWLDISCRQALSVLKPALKQEKQTKSRTPLAGLYGGFSAILACSFVNLMIFCYQSGVAFELAKVQYMSIKVNLVIATMIVGMGFNVYVFSKRKLAFTYICGIPPELVMHQGHRDILRVGFIQLNVVLVSAILLCVGQLGLTGPLPVLFGQFVPQISRIVKPTYWMLFPTLTLPAFTACNLSKARGQKSVFAFCMATLFKMFMPWRQRIELSHTLFCSLLGSASSSFKDIIRIISANRLPDFGAIVFQNVFSLNRLVQGSLKFIERRQFYSQGWGMLNNICGMLGTLTSLEAIIQNKPAYWVLTAFKSYYYLVKIYWNTGENWGLLWGGVSVIKFKNKPEVWSHGKYLRRPTKLPLHVIIPIALYDPIARVTWVIAYFPSCSGFSDKIWFKLLTTLMSVARAYLWMILRVDNFVCSNCQDSYETKYYPVNCKKYQRNRSPLNTGIQSQQNNQDNSNTCIKNVNSLQQHAMFQQINENQIINQVQIPQPYKITCQTFQKLSENMKSFVQINKEAKNKKHKNDTVETSNGVNTEIQIANTDVELVTPISNTIWK